MAAKFMKGNEALIHAAARAGCRCFFGYPITPSSEGLETAMKLFPALKFSAVQAESEPGASFMLYGAGAAGERVMTITSGPGMVWLQDALNYCAMGEIPCVVVDIMRGGPALGNICPSGADYRMATRPGGNGDYHLIVLSASSVQEIADLTHAAFEIADKWRNPVVVLGDGMIGQMKESVVLPEFVKELPKKPWAICDAAGVATNKVVPFDLEAEGLEKINLRLEQKYSKVRETEVRFERIDCEKCELLVVAHGMVGRIMKSVLKEAKKEGLNAGLIRPITVWPFPSDVVREEAARAGKVLVAEMSLGQMIEDVRLAVNGAVPVNFYGRSGGVVPNVSELLEQVRKHIAGRKEA